MAFTVVDGNSVSDYPESGRRIIFGTITGDSAYVTAVGGSVVNPSVFGAVTHPITGATLYPAPSVIDSMIVGLSTDGTRVAVYNPTTNRMALFSTNAAPIVELGTADQSGKVYPFVAVVR